MARVTSAEVREYAKEGRLLGDRYRVHPDLLDAIADTLAEYEPIVAAYETGTSVWACMDALTIVPSKADADKFAGIWNANVPSIQLVFEPVRIVKEPNDG